MGALRREFASGGASPGATSAHYGFAARKWRLRNDRPRPGGSATANGTPYPAGYMVPLPPSGRTHVHGTARSGTAVHRRKLLITIDQAGIDETGDVRKSGKPDAHPRAVADQNGNHCGTCALPNGAETSSLRGNHLRQQNRMGGGM